MGFDNEIYRFKIEGVLDDEINWIALEKFYFLIFSFISFDRKKLLLLLKFDDELMKDFYLLVENENEYSLADLKNKSYLEIVSNPNANLGIVEFDLQDFEVKLVKKLNSLDEIKELIGNQKINFVEENVERSFNYDFV